MFAPFYFFPSPDFYDGWSVQENKLKGEIALLPPFSRSLPKYFSLSVFARQTFKGAKKIKEI